MSDRVTNAEIEDVLSSIRRLVSVDDRASNALSTAPAPSQSEDDHLSSRSYVKQIVDSGVQVTTDNKTLVLSQNLLVTQSDPLASSESGEPLTGSSEADMIADATPDDPEPAEVLGLAKWQVEAGPAEPEVVEPLPDNKSDEAFDLTTGDLEQRISVARRMREIALSKPKDGSSPDGSEMRPQTKTLEGAASGSKELEARIAEVEAAVAARDDQWEPDGSEPNAGVPPSISSISWLQKNEALDETPTPYSGDTETTGEPIESAKAPDAAPRSPNEKPVSNEQDYTEEHWYGEDAVLDEAALRDLVSEIVRQELQGSLGERITRNVRKLVRREIQRAMMGHDFD